jgi:hypothetical protein
MASAEQEMQTKIAALNAHMDHNTAQQEQQLAALRSSVDTNARAIRQRSADLAANISIVNALMTSGLATLESGAAADRPHVVAALETSLAALQFKLGEILQQTKFDLSQAVAGRIRESQHAIDLEREASNVTTNFKFPFLLEWPLDYDPRAYCWWKFSGGRVAGARAGDPKKCRRRCCGGSAVGGDNVGYRRSDEARPIVSASQRYGD